MHGGLISEAWEIMVYLKKEENSPSLYCWLASTLLSGIKGVSVLFNHPPTALPLPGVQYGSLVSLAHLNPTTLLTEMILARLWCSPCYALITSVLGLGFSSVFLKVWKTQAEFRSVTMQDAVNVMKCRDWRYTIFGKSCQWMSSLSVTRWSVWLKSWPLLGCLFQNKSLL